MNYLMTLDTNLVEDMIKPHVINKRKEMAATTIQKYYRKYHLDNYLEEEYDEYLDDTIYDLTNAGFKYIVADMKAKIGLYENELNSITFTSTNELEWLCINKLSENKFYVSGQLDDEDINSRLNEKELYENIVYLRYDYENSVDEYIIYGVGDNGETIDEWLDERKIKKPTLVKLRNFTEVSYQSAYEMIESSI